MEISIDYPLIMIIHMDPYGGFLSHRGTKTISNHHPFSSMDFPMEIVTIQRYFGTPVAMESSRTGNGSKVKTPQGQIDLD